MSKNDSSSPAAWLRRAKSDFELARQPKPSGVLWEDLCFHAQQAAEKSLKAVLILRGVDFPKTHDLGELADIAAKAGVELPESVPAAAELSAFAVQLRYPGDYEQVTGKEHKKALALAENVFRWAEKLIKSERKESSPPFGGRGVR